MHFAVVVGAVGVVGWVVDVVVVCVAGVCYLGC